jgi:diketogulonate reductase-like aldo/keto reductase
MLLADHKPEDVKPALARSLKRLGLEYLDLWLMHYPAATDPKDPEGTITVIDVPYIATWRAMEECVKLGLVKNIGISSMSLLVLLRVQRITTLQTTRRKKLKNS